MGDGFKVGENAPTLPELDVGTSPYNTSVKQIDKDYVDGEGKPIEVPVNLESINNFHELTRSGMTHVAAFYLANDAKRAFDYLANPRLKIATTQVDQKQVTLNDIAAARLEVTGGRIRVTYTDSETSQFLDPSADLKQKHWVYVSNDTEDPTNNGYWIQMTGPNPNGVVNGEYSFAYTKDPNFAWGGPTLNPVNFKFEGDKIRRRTPQEGQKPRIDIIDAKITIAVFLQQIVFFYFEIYSYI